MRPADTPNRGPHAVWRVDPDGAVALPLPVQAALSGFLAERFPRARGRALDHEVADLSEVFTAARDELPRSYLNKPPVRSAYLAYFHPLQMLRGGAALAESFERARARGLWRPDPARPLRVVDLGAGLGALSQALVALAATVPEIAPGGLDLTLVDHQRGALQDARDLTLRTAEAVAPGAQPPRIRTVAVTMESWVRERRPVPFDLVLTGGVWNELRTDWEPVLSRLLPVVSPDGLVVAVEPALAPVGRRLMALREAFLDRTTTVAPCTHGAACPLLSLKRDWCFTARRAELPAEVVRMARGLGHQTSQVRYLLWAFGPRPGAAPFPGGAARVVTDPMDGEQVLCTEGRRERARLPAGTVRGSLARRS